MIQRRRRRQALARDCVCLSEKDTSDANPWHKYQWILNETKCSAKEPLPVLIHSCMLRVTRVVGTWRVGATVRGAIVILLRNECKNTYKNISKNAIHFCIQSKLVLAVRSWSLIRYPLNWMTVSFFFCNSGLLQIFLVAPNRAGRAGRLDQSIKIIQAGTCSRIFDCFPAHVEIKVRTKSVFHLKRKRISTHTLPGNRLDGGVGESALRAYAYIEAKNWHSTRKKRPLMHRTALMMINSNYLCLDRLTYSFRKKQERTDVSRTISQATHRQWRTWALKAKN